MITISVKSITKPVNQVFSERGMIKNMMFAFCFWTKLEIIYKRVKSILIFYINAFYPDGQKSKHHMFESEHQTFVIAQRRSIENIHRRES